MLQRCRLVPPTARWGSDNAHEITCGAGCLLRELHGVPLPFVLNEPAGGHGGIFAQPPFVQAATNIEFQNCSHIKTDVPSLSSEATAEKHRCWSSSAVTNCAQYGR
jgi:hypothetical protein